MAKLNAAARKAIPSQDFAGPDRSYPIEDESHAKDALAYASHDASPALDASIKRKVKSKYPDMIVKGMR